MAKILRETYEGLSKQQQVFVAGASVLATAGVACGAAWWWYRKKTPSELVFKPVGKLSTIFIHPIKSCRGQEVTMAECTPTGLRGDNGLFDRNFIILDENDNKVTLRMEPTLALVLPSLSEDGKRFILEAPGMDTLDVSFAEITSSTNPILKFRMWRLDSSGLYCGQRCEAWISTYLGKQGSRLAYFKQGVIADRILQQDTRWGHRFTDEKLGGYTELSQYNVATEASLEDLNTRLEKPASMRSFRPNLVVSGTGAFDEDNWKYLKIGDTVVLRRSHTCGRCILVTVDPETGVKNSDNEPLKTLKEYRLLDKSLPDSKVWGKTYPVFGSNLQCEVTGQVRVGDIVYAVM
ncbi:mitochondrial amidoxime-reducing component 1-like [Asterias amurensis]|uniref:mitochondrial amidoxime-reducing component 1-like n=1 Tax=Asterias amurensis TaxID=7602 RepID=UPI003AB71082